MVSIIEIVLYTKPTAEHQYRVLCSSCHHLHTKRAFSFSLALRIRRICSSNETYNLGLLNQKIQRFHTITHTLTQAPPPPPPAPKSTYFLSQAIQNQIYICEWLGLITCFETDQWIADVFVAVAVVDAKAHYCLRNLVIGQEQKFLGANWHGPAVSIRDVSQSHRRSFVSGQESREWKFPLISQPWSLCNVFAEKR